jgi:glutamyl-tRNA reductase
MIANRTYERAEKIAKKLNGTAVHFDTLDEVLTQADIVICSTGAPHIVLHADTVATAQQERNGRPLLVADLAVPRDADPDIASIPGVTLTNIDGLDVIVKTSHPLTKSICQEVEVIAQQELESFIRWFDTRRCVPIIQALHGKAETICQEEVQRTLKKLGPLTPAQEKSVQAMGKAIVSKLLCEPITYLKETPSELDSPEVSKLVKRLFGLHLQNLNEKREIK